MRRIVHINVIACLLALAAFASLPVHEVFAATLAVTKTTDTNDGVCNIDCSLREAIAVAAPGDTITFAPALSGQTIILTIDSLNINKTLIIDGSSLASPVKVSGNNQRNVFIIEGINLTVTFTALDIINGYGVERGSGGGIFINAGDTVANLNNVTMSGNRIPSGAGGAMFIQGSAVTVNVHNSTFTSNGTGNYTDGGAIFNYGMTLNVTSSTFASNAAGMGSYGGAILNYNNGTTKVTNTTFTGNNVGTGLGAAITNLSATIEITNSTFSDNNGGGAFYNLGTASVYNSIFANTTGGPDCQGNAFTANSGNLIETRSGCSAPAFTADPLLGPLADNSGSTQTMALLDGSPAINTGDNSNCAATDQRGVVRPQDVTCDIGAFEVDVTPPSVTVTSSAPNPTNTSPIPVTITFSESVTGFELGDLTIGNGIAGNFSGFGDTYTADITPDADGLVTVDVNADVTADAAGNGNTAAAQFSITFNGTPPEVTITSSVASPTNTAPIPVTITFSEAVTGFEQGDLTVGNGTAGNFSGSDTTYTVEITPIAGGLVTVDVTADVAVDVDGNGNNAAAQFSIVYDTTGPGVTINTSASDPTNLAPIPLTITFSEPVTGFELGDLTVGNGAAGNFSGSDTTYTVDITPTADGLVTMDIAADVAADPAGNGNNAAAQFSITFNGTPPEVTITSSVASPTNTSPIPVTITFSEPVTGFKLTDLTVGNGTAGSFSGADDLFTVVITPTADGLVTVDIAAGVATDAAGNGNTAAAQFSVTYDATPPTAAMDPLPGTLPRTFTVSWSGNDALSGIAYFVVQVQQDGGSWTDWQSKTTATSAQFTGEAGILYSFRVRAVDNAGNVGAWSAPVETKVSLGIYLPMIRKTPLI